MTHPTCRSIVLLIATCARLAIADPPATQPTVTAPPERIFATLSEPDQQAALGFYRKYLDVGGLSVVAGEAVADEALLRTWEIVSHMLAGRADVLEHMQKRGTRLIIIGKDQVYTDMPDYRHEPDPAYMNERVRGTGGLDITSFGEENLLNLPIDRYDDESIAVHEFCHTIDAALQEIDPTWPKRLEAVFQNAIAKGCWRDAYALSNQGEYWAEVAQSYLDCNRTNNWNHRNVGTREQLREYDPEGYELARDTFRFSSATDWRFSPMRTQPSVIAPPASFKIDPYFTRFTFARELPIIASPRVSDAALLQANRIVRRLFAYRHDVLKMLISDGARLVVLAPDESLSDLPQFHLDATTQAVWDDARLFEYSVERKVMVVPEENLLGHPTDRLGRTNAVVRVLSRAMYSMAAQRPRDAGWATRPSRSVQQYEKRVQRLDELFRDRVDVLYKASMDARRWRGTPASNNAASYWSAGVEAYFDAAGDEEPPEGSPVSITTRETLRDYDPDLYTLVDSVFAYRGRVDWRCQRP